MTASVTVQIKGLAQLQRALHQLPLEMRGKPVDLAVAAGARVIRDEAKALASKMRKTGNLEANIVVAKSRKRSGNGRSEYAVLVRRKRGKYADTRNNRRKGRVGRTYYIEGDAYYWRFLEFGTRKMAKRPFMRPAFDNKKTEALEVITSTLAKQLQRALAKARFKA